MDHLGDATDDHIANGRRPIALHDVLKRSQKVLLKAEICKFAFLDKLHGELTQAIDGKEGHILIGACAHLVEMVAENLPNTGPLETDTTHVVVGNFDNFLQTEHPWLGRISQFFQ